MSRPIVAEVWQHRESGQRVSMGGAAPWATEEARTEWDRVQVGWTVRHPDGTTGIGRVPFRSEEAAQDWCDRNPQFPGMGQG